MRALVVCLAVTAAVLMLAAPGAHALTFDFTSDHCTGTCGTPPFGTVTLTDNGTGVDVVVHLNAGYSYVKTGAGDFQAFKFNAVDVALSDILVDAHVPALAAAQAGTPGGFSGDGTGEFDFGINCPSCGNGGAGAFTGDISFEVLNAEISDLTVPNNLGNIFVADVLAPNGNTGPIDVTGGGGNGGTGGIQVPEPATILLLGSGLVAAAGMGGAWGWRRKK